MPKRVKVNDQTLQFRVGAEYSGAASFYESARLACFQHGLNLVKHGKHLQCDQSCPWSLHIEAVPGSRNIRIAKFNNNHDHCNVTHLSTFRTLRIIEGSTPGGDDSNMDKSDGRGTRDQGRKRKRDEDEGKSRAEAEVSKAGALSFA